MLWGPSEVFAGGWLLAQHWHLPTGASWSMLTCQTLTALTSDSATAFSLLGQINQQVIYLK